MREFGPTLRRLRKSRRVTLTTLACSIGVAPSYLSDVELGRRPPLSEYACDRAAHALSLDPAEAKDILILSVMERGVIDIPYHATPHAVAAAMEMLSVPHAPSRLDELMAALALRPDVVTGDGALTQAQVDALLEPD